MFQSLRKMRWIHTRWNSVLATIFSLYLTSGTNGQGISLSTTINLAPTSTPTTGSDMSPRSMLIYIASIIGGAVIVTAIVMLICCLCLYCKRRKMRTLQPNEIEGKNSNGNMGIHTLQYYCEDKFEWRDFELADPETTSFGVPSNVNSRAPSPERESLEYEEILPMSFNPLHITNPLTVNKSNTSPRTGLPPQIQGLGDVSSGIKQAKSMSALCQQQKYEANLSCNQEALDIYDKPTVLAKSSALVPYHQHLSSLPKHKVSTFATKYHSMKDLSGAASLHEQLGPCQVVPKGESIYDIPRAALEVSGTEITRSYQGEGGGKRERVDTQLYYDVPKQVVASMRENTSLQVQENDTEVTTTMQLEPFLWNTRESLPRPEPIPASIPKPFQLTSFATNSHAPLTSVSTTVDTTDTCSTYDVPKQVLSNTQEACSSETKLPSISKPVSMSEHGSEADSYTHDISVLTMTTSHEPTTNTDADHYDVPKRLVANRVLAQHHSSLPKTSAACLPHLTATKPIEPHLDDMGIYDMPKHNTPQRIGDEVDSVEDEHIYDLPPTEMIEELRQKRANYYSCSYQLSSITEGTGSHARHEARSLNKDFAFTDRLLGGKRSNMATYIEQVPSLGNENIPQQELAMRNIKEKVDTQGYNHMDTKTL